MRFAPQNPHLGGEVATLIFHDLFNLFSTINKCKHVLQDFKVFGHFEKCIFGCGRQIALKCCAQFDPIHQDKLCLSSDSSPQISS